MYEYCFDCQILICKQTLTINTLPIMYVCYFTDPFNIKHFIQPFFFIKEIISVKFCNITQFSKMHVWILLINICENTLLLIHKQNKKNWWNNPQSPSLFINSIFFNTKVVVFILRRWSMFQFITYCLPIVCYFKQNLSYRVDTYIIVHTSKKVFNI